MKQPRQNPLSQASGLIFLFLVGCSTIPGMQVDLWEPPQSRTEIAKEVEVFPITPETIRQLNDDRTQVSPIDKLLDLGDPAASKPYQYIVGAQDVLRVTVWDHPELNNPGAITGTPMGIEGGLPGSSTSVLGTANDSTARIVGDDGTMFYPYIGVVHVAGKTPEEIRAFLMTQLARSIRNPQVEVVVASYRSKRIYVTGEVKTPGSVPITDIPLTVADAVAAAGGINLDADLSGVTLNRNGIRTKLDLYAFLYRGNASQNVMLRNGDVLNVPEQRFNKIFVLGEVVKPASLLMPRGDYTLNEALADAGGVSQLTAKASQIYVIRGDITAPKVFHLDARSPDALILADSFMLNPRDIIFVDAAAIVRFNRVISQVLPALQALQAGKYLGQ
jgi:polysaccharide export outer membrane protein